MPVIPCPDCGRDVSTLAPVCPHCGRPSPAGTTPMVAPPPLAREEPRWNGSPSATLLIPQIVGIVLVLVGVPLFFRFFASTAEDDVSAGGMMRFGWIATALIVTIQVVALLISWIKLRSTTYSISTQRILIERGIFSKTVDEIDLRYVDDSQFAQNFVERMLGIGHVTLISSDANTPRYVLRSIKDPRGVRELIRAEAYQISQRQIFTRST